MKKQIATFGSTLVLLLVALTVVPTPAQAATVRVLEISEALAKPQVPWKGFDGNPPKLFDIDGDGDMEIIAQNDNQWVYVFDSRTGRILFEAKTWFPPGWGARSFNGPEVEILSDDGKVHLVVENSAAVVTNFVFDPAGSNQTRFKFTKLWETRLTECYDNPGSDSKIVFGDLDRDGKFEILAATEEIGLYALNRDGSKFWTACIGGGNAEPTVGDLNGDGWMEVIHVSDAGVVTALNGQTGATLWRYDARVRFNLHSGSMTVGAAVGQLDGVGGLDIVVGARDSHDSVNWSNSHALLLALNDRGQLLWGKQDPQGAPLTYTHAIIADVEGDGEAEVYWADWNTIGHKPPWDEKDSWKVTGPAHFYRYAKDGTMVWRQTIDSWWQNKDIALADVDGDGQQEVLAVGPNAQGRDGVWYLDARTGAREQHVSVYPYQIARAPVLGDLYGTGKMQWVVQVGPSAPGYGPGILVYDTGVRFNAMWPHLPPPVRGTPPPPPSGSFPSTFTVKSPNNWWQEVYVSTQNPYAVSKVEVRINCGTWQSMSKSSWGAWTSSYHAANGARVEFLATDTQRQVSQSDVFTWMDGQLTKGSVPYGGCNTTPPPPQGFTATYSVPSSVNEWWVEVKVTSTHVVSGVDARVNGGAWVGLTKQSWGNWAKSFHVPAGNKVQFRATNAAGETNLSQEFCWLQTSCGTSPPPTTTTVPPSTTTTTPPPTTTQPPGSFGATYSVPSGVNEWWVEVKVTATQAVHGVNASVNGGAWIPLTKQSWGNWAKSFYVEPGSRVQFRATSTTGATNLSQVLCWMQSCAAPPSEFTATFTPHAVGNDWWVEVKVTSAHKVVGVEASVNGGAWTALTKQSWGHWAKSFFVANNSEVRFRATNEAGATVVSQPVIWT